MTDLYAVIGNPVAHSRSPSIHGEFARQTGQNLSYGLQLVELGQFARAVDGLRRDQAYRGFNITVPFKLDALEYARAQGGEISKRADLAGAVNFLKIDGGRVLADNTDGVGLVRDITQRMGVSMKSKRVLILGAGGAARGVILPLIEAGAASVCLANRTVRKAQDLVSAFQAQVSAPLRACALEEADLSVCDVLINATSSGLSRDAASLVDKLPAPAGSVPVLAYDMVYGAQPSVFMLWASALGIGKVCDGLGMLVEQAAEGFELWRGVRPDANAVFANLRSELSAKPAAA
jgi:shikimate dehydrogenase